ncbi:hypothetical protein SAMN04487895_12751 [Paenibacillus sophorae]|uniref:Uncharacterized protein n=1 Tax=Paenibacillus sophorae TaxID=1333845 RepID=A0A1H8VTI5_9BACL|nr:hypothetical protein [Paenibacillus sophorae]QWU15703.1 hypothetical protein KP014_28470 [Paenibacillus sophorae]SEP18701.1 hypothetical protein SAMN04487895_12751 [Paenibacillus sophorae]
MTTIIFPNDLDRQKTLELADEAAEQLQSFVAESGVSDVLQSLEERLGQSSGNIDLQQHFLLSILKIVVVALYRLPSHSLNVITGKDRNGLFVSAQCSSGAYAEWHSDPALNVFENWTRGCTDEPGDA